VRGTKPPWILEWPHIPDVWPVLSSTHLTCQDTLLVQDAVFKLQERPSMSPRRKFTFIGLPNPDIYLTTWNSNSISRNANAPMAKHHNKWESMRHIKGTALGVTILPFSGLGAIISLESRIQSNGKVY
jgi:hypothetical protein